MSSKVAQKKGEYSELSTEKAPLNPRKKFTWNWLPNEKKIIIILMIVMWSYLLFDYFLMNQRIADKIQGLSDGVFGLKMKRVKLTICFSNFFHLGYP